MAQNHNGDLTLRHYEAIRNIMLENNHRSGLIWVTGFSWKSKTTTSLEEQSVWIKQAYLIMRRQLYIGAAFFQSLNSSINSSSESSLVFRDGNFHPVLDEIGQIIALEYRSQTNSIDAANPDISYPLPVGEVNP
jgi:hypothetical protein